MIYPHPNIETSGITESIAALYCHHRQPQEEAEQLDALLTPKAYSDVETKENSKQDAVRFVVKTSPLLQFEEARVLVQTPVSERRLVRRHRAR